MNPYMPPTFVPSPQIQDPGNGAGHQGAVRSTNNQEIIRSWERLRFLYNLILLPFGVAVAMIARDGGVPLAEVLFASVSVGFFANAFYFFGPLFEIYSCSFRELHEFGRGRWLLFMAGLLISLGLFYMVANSFLYLAMVGW